MSVLRRAFLVTLVWSCSTAATSRAIVNGAPSTPDTPGGRSTVVLTLPSGTICSGTVVGPRIVLTTAYCAAASDHTTTIFAKVGEQIQEMTCARDPRSMSDIGENMALCASASPLVNQPIARVGVDPSRVALGSMVDLFGYGCRLAGGIDRGVGQLTSKRASVVRVAGTMAMLSGVVLCSGDGGGGAYVPSPDGGNAVLVGVSSRTDFQDHAWVALTTAPTFVTWARAWSESRGGICGMSDAAACVETVTTALQPPPDLPEATRAAERLLTITPPADGPSVAGVPVRQLVRITLRKGETLDNGVGRACGIVRDEYFTALASLKREGQTSLVRGRPVDADMDIDILPCPRLVAGLPRTVEVRKGDRVWKYYLETLRERPGAGWRGLEAPVGSSTTTRAFYFVDAVRTLNPGVDQDNLAIGRNLQLPTVPVATPANYEAPTVVAPSDIRAILALQGTDGDCVAPDHYEGYPFDTEALLDVLIRNRAMRSSLHLDEAKPTLVLTADTGIFGSGQGIFLNKGVLLQDGGEYDDLRPLSEGPEPMHGTEVATLLLGGPFLSKIQAISPRRIQLVSSRIYQQTIMANGTTFYSAEPGVMGGIIEKIREGAKIVNLSLKSTAKLQFDALANQIADRDARALFVTAAGNHDGLLGTPGIAVYPAMFGGENALNLLVVAALDGKGDLAPFSNYGSEYVEIGAPGCLVPTLSAILGPGGRTIRFDPIYATGTSLASPLVAFGAALLEFERADTKDMSPAQVKRRLLVSADLRTNLTPFIADGRVLNLVKAASVFHDVVELKNPSRLVFGEVSFVKDEEKLEESHALELTCNGAKVPPLLIRDILKVVPAFVKNGKPPTFKVYARSTDSTKVLRNFECDAPEGLGIVVHDTDENTEATYNLDEIVDIVRHERYPT